MSGHVCLLEGKDLYYVVNDPAAAGGNWRVAPVSISLVYPIPGLIKRRDMINQQNMTDMA